MELLVKKLLQRETQLWLRVRELEGDVLRWRVRYLELLSKDPTSKTVKMVYDYHGNRILGWMPRAMADGCADRRLPFSPLGNLYRWRRAPVSALLYVIGRWVCRN